MHKNFPYLDLDIDLTIKSINQVKKFTTESSFLLKKIANLLPTAEREYRWDKNNLPENIATCRRCGLFQETDFHLWRCLVNDKEAVKSSMVESLTLSLLKVINHHFSPLTLANTILNFDPYYSHGMITISDEALTTCDAITGDTMETSRQNIGDCYKIKLFDRDLKKIKVRKTI